MPTRTRPTPRQDATLSGQLRKVIVDRGLSAYGVAQAAGLNPAVVSRFQAGSRDIRMETADRIAAALGLRLTEGAARGRGRPRNVGRPVVPPSGAGDGSLLE